MEQTASLSLPLPANPALPIERVFRQAQNAGKLRQAGRRPQWFANPLLPKLAQSAFQTIQLLDIKVWNSVFDPGKRFHRTQCNSGSLLRQAGANRHAHFLYCTAPEPDVHSPSMILPRSLHSYGSRSTWLWAGLLAGLLCAPLLRAGENPPPPAPVASKPDWDRFEVAFETGVTFGINNPNHYITTPEIISFRWQRKAPEQFFHTPFTFSEQWTWNTEAVAIPRGPEDHYFGMGPGVRLVYGKSGSPFSVYLDGRFIVGAIDSSGPPAGQGQDLTFSALVGSGLQYEVKRKMKVSAGFLYEHFSNGGLSEPQAHNTGLNTVGPKFEFTYSF